MFHEQFVVMKNILCFSWFLAVVTVVKGSFKTCEGIKEASINASIPNVISIAGKDVKVSCNFTSEPVETTLVVHQAFQIPDPSYGGPDLYSINANYGNLSVEDVKTFLDQSVRCKQYVSYTCTNASLFGNKKASLSWWTSIDNVPKYYWANCGFSDKNCLCDANNDKIKEDSGYLVKKEDLPVKSVVVQGLTTFSNATVKIGNIVCYGDISKGSFTLTNQNAYATLNVSAMKELRFLFKSLYTENDKIIASIRTSEGDNIVIGLNNDSRLNTAVKTDVQTFDKIDQEWHTIALYVEEKIVKIAIDDKAKKPLFESPRSFSINEINLGAVDGDCRSFVGCLKDLSVDGKDYTDEMKATKMKSFVREGCLQPRSVECNPRKTVEDISTTVSTEAIPTKISTDAISTTVSSTPMVNPVTKSRDKDNGEDKDDDSGSDSNGAIIAIVVVCVLLLIILIIAFFITWYLKRNKGVYQTHEGSAENINADMDNMTLVTKPCEDGDREQGKEYYL